MKTLLTTLVAVAVLIAYSSLPLQAQLLTFTFPGAGNSTTPQQPTITANGSVTGQAGVGTGIGLDTNGYVSGYQAHGNESGDSFPASLATSESDNAYYTFTITPDSGDLLNLTYLDLSNTTFFYQLAGAGSSYAVMDSTDGFTTAGTLLDTYNPASDSDNSVQGTKLTLSGLSGVTGPVEFRVYVYGQSGNYFLTSLENSFSIDGTAKPIPEPSTDALLLAGAVALVALGRRFAKRT